MEEIDVEEDHLIYYLLNTKLVSLNIMNYYQPVNEIRVVYYSSHIKMNKTCFQLVLNQNNIYKL